MNIFKLDEDPKLAAQYHHNGHFKLILEAAQILSTAVRLNCPDVNSPLIYNKTHEKHPCIIAASNSRYIFDYTAQLGIYLNEERKYRFNIDKDHKSVFTIIECQKYIDKIPDNEWAWPLAMPEIYKDNDPVLSYRRYYINEKTCQKNGKWMMIYGRREIPFWIPDNLKEQIKKYENVARENTNINPF